MVNLASLLRWPAHGDAAATGDQALDRLVALAYAEQDVKIAREHSAALSAAVLEFERANLVNSGGMVLRASSVMLDTAAKHLRTYFDALVDARKNAGITLTPALVRELGRQAERHVNPTLQGLAGTVQRYCRSHGITAVTDEVIAADVSRRVRQLREKHQRTVELMAERLAVAGVSSSKSVWGFLKREWKWVVGTLITIITLLLSVL